MPYDPSNDPEFDAFAARMQSAENADAEAKLTEDIAARRKQREDPIGTFVMNLPKNIGIGAYKGFVNTIDTMSDIAMKAQPGAMALDAMGEDKARSAMYPSLSEQYPEAMSAIRNFTTEWERNDNLGDDISQGVAQFTLPFLGWMKVLGGANAAAKTATVGKALTAEAVASASALEPHDGRVADLFELGRESETRLGSVLREISPDGSLVNRYIEYMTDRENEGVAEGRWKNAVDSLVSSVTLAGVLKAIPSSLKFGKFLLEDAGISGGPGAKYQKGQVAFHGTPHDFDAFDLSKLGTGEGNQAYGHGLYFAEAEGVAKQYRGTLSKKQFTPGSAMENAYSAMENANWDAKQAYSVLMQKAARAQDTEWRETLTRAAEKIKAGNVKQLGKLMTVEIPDEAVAKMLDYDAPLDARAIAVFKKLGVEVPESLGKPADWLAEGSGVKEFVPTGSWAYEQLSKQLGSDKAASEALRDAGVPGIRYLDGNSRSPGKGTRNIVLFDDKLVKITKKE